MYMICALNKSNGRYTVGALHASEPKANLALAEGLRQAQVARYRRRIPPAEIDVANARVLRAWETRGGGGIAVITDTPDRVPSQSGPGVALA